MHLFDCLTVVDNKRACSDGSTVPTVLALNIIIVPPTPDLLWVHSDAFISVHTLQWRWKDSAHLLLYVQRRADNWPGEKCLDDPLTEDYWGV